MPKMTLLEMVQDILSDMESDPVNSINDTVEALQVAQIIKTTFYELLTDNDWPHLGTLMQLDSSTDSTKPNYMRLSTPCNRIEWIKYNKKEAVGDKEKYKDVAYKSIEDFMDISNLRDSTQTNVEEVVDDSGVSLFILNDRHPTYWTTFDNSTIVFDSYFSDLDSTLQASKSQVYGYREPSFILLDATVPDLPANAFPYLLSEAKSVAFNVIKQAANQKEEQRAQRQKRRLSRARWSHGNPISYPNYGRNK